MVGVGTRSGAAKNLASRFSGRLPILLEMLSPVDNRRSSLLMLLSALPKREGEGQLPTSSAKSCASFSLDVIISAR